MPDPRKQPNQNPSSPVAGGGAAGAADNPTQQPHATESCQLLDHAILHCMILCRDYTEHLTKSSVQNSDPFLVKKKIVSDAYQILDCLLSEAPAELLQRELEKHLPEDQRCPTPSSESKYSISDLEITLKNIPVEKKKKALNDFKEHLFGKSDENLETLQKHRDNGLILFLRGIFRALRWATQWLTRDSIDWPSIFFSNGNMLCKKVAIEMRGIITPEDSLATNSDNSISPQ